MLGYLKTLSITTSKKRKKTIKNKKTPVKSNYGSSLRNFNTNKTHQKPFEDYQRSFEHFCLQCDDALQNAPISHL